MNPIFLDTETTGIEAGKDKICQLCYKTPKGIVVAYFKPEIPMSVKAMSITHITNKMLADKEAFATSKVKAELQEELSKGVLIAHNAKFDCSMLKAEGVEIPRHICTLRLARHLDSKGVIPEYNLQFLRYYLDLDIKGNAHDAEGDVNVLEGVFERLFAKMKAGTTMTDEEVMQKMIEISATPSLFRTINFGKYRGKTLEEVAAEDSRYLKWLLDEKLKSAEDEEDWIYTLKHYLKIR